jgi:hypothetical protein
MVPISRRNRWTAPVSPVMATPVSDPAKMRAARARVVAVIVTSACAGGGRALAAPGTVNRLELPHSFRAAEGTAFLAMMALGHLPALFALPAGVGDITAGIAALLVARRLAQGGARRAALWFNAFGMTDLVVALALGALTGFQLINVTPSGAPISELPLVLIPTAAVPLLFALHITSVSALVKTPRTTPLATARLIAAAR